MASVTDTLAFWAPYSDERLAVDYFDWGVAVPGSSADKEFRVRNLSSVYTARDVEVSIQELNTGDATVSVAAQHYLSLDGRNFAAVAQIGSLAAQAISDRIVLRRVTAINADLGEHDFQLLAHADSWN